MALQNGVININGQLGDLVFYKCSNQDIVRQKTGHKQKQKK